jgi:hypothetical protein
VLRARPWFAFLLVAAGCAPQGESGARAPNPDIGRSAAAAVADPHFALVADERCGSGAETRVEDFGARTLLVSPTRARFFDPGRPGEAAVDVSADLPADRGSSSVFATRPPILAVKRRPPVEGVWVDPLFLFAGGRWTKMHAYFGETPIAVPVETGQVVIGWVLDPVHGDPRGMPQGDLTRAWRVAPDGTVSAWPAWPYVMSWQVHSTLTVVWAIAAKPRHAGQFLLRLPIDGRARLFPIPGFGSCRGDDRLSQLVRLVSVTDGEARVSIDSSGCVPESASGRYRFVAARGRWLREGPPVPYLPQSDGDVEATSGDQTFSVGVGEVLVRGPAGQRRHFSIEDLHPASPASPGGVLRLTAGGREVWVVMTARNERCRVYRY